MGAPPLQISDDGLVLNAWVVPGANRTETAGLHDDLLKIRVAAPASGGEANSALIGFLRRRTGCAVTIVSGAGSRQKRIRIESADLSRIADTLGIAPG